MTFFCFGKSWVRKSAKTTRPTTPKPTEKSRPTVPNSACASNKGSVPRTGGQFLVHQLQWTCLHTAKMVLKACWSKNLHIQFNLFNQISNLRKWTFTLFVLQDRKVEKETHGSTSTVREFTNRTPIQLTQRRHQDQSTRWICFFKLHQPRGWLQHPWTSKWFETSLFDLPPNGSHFNDPWPEKLRPPKKERQTSKASPFPFSVAFAVKLHGCN